MTDPESILHHGAGTPPGCFIIKGRRIKIKTEILKSRFRRKFPYIGLLVQKPDDSFFEAVAFPAADISGVLAVRAVINRFQIVFRKTGGHKKILFTAAQDFKLFLQGVQRMTVTVQ